MEHPSNKQRKFLFKVAMLVSEWTHAEKKVGLATEMVATSAAESVLVKRLRANSIQKCNLSTSQFLKFTRRTLISERGQNKSINNCIRQLREMTNSLKVIMG